MEQNMELRKFIATTIREYLNEQETLGNNRFEVYHGTKNEFNDFNYSFIKDGGLFGYGFYFSQSIKVSKEEGGNIIYKCLIFDKKSNILDFRTNAKMTKKIFNLINNGLQKNNKEPFDEYYLNYSTSQFYNSFLLPKFVNEKVLTSFLLDCNIRGIMNTNQYKSLNFTVFDKNDIRILERVF
jgi:hypothetical protein